jgi:hypothetical protein
VPIEVFLIKFPEAITCLFLPTPIRLWRVLTPTSQLELTAFPRLKLVEIG